MPNRIRSHGGVLAVTSLSDAPARRPVLSENGQAAVERMVKLQEAPRTVQEIALPEAEKPAWYKEQMKLEQQAAANAQRPAAVPRVGTNPHAKVFTYTIRTDNAQSSTATFSTLANETLNDPRGWARLGVRFQEVPSGGQFNLILAAAYRVPSYAPGGCSADLSCRVGSSVIINETRWNEATSAWNGGGGSLRDYRHMVVNHEVGHWLGHDHRGCTTPGGPAPVMQQQSVDLQGCRFNPWPLAGELWTNR